MLKIHYTCTLICQEVWLTWPFMALRLSSVNEPLRVFFSTEGLSSSCFSLSSVLSDRVREKISNSHLKESIKQSQSPPFTELFYFQLQASAEVLTDHLT